MFRFVSVSVLLCPSLTRSSWSSAPAPLPLAHFFFPSPFTIFTVCFPSCVCKAASNKALADNVILQHNQSRSFPYNISSAQTLGWSKVPIGACGRSTRTPAHRHRQLCPRAGTRAEPLSRQGGQERGSCRSLTAKRHPERFTLCLLEGNAIN